LYSYFRLPNLNNDQPNCYCCQERRNHISPIPPKSAHNPTEERRTGDRPYDGNDEERLHKGVREISRSGNYPDGKEDE
jgi:hypothetical protein